MVFELMKHWLFGSLLDWLLEPFDDEFVPLRVLLEGFWLIFTLGFEIVETSEELTRNKAQMKKRKREVEVILNLKFLQCFRVFKLDL